MNTFTDCYIHNFIIRVSVSRCVAKQPAEPASDDMAGGQLQSTRLKRMPLGYSHGRKSRGAGGQSLIIWSGTLMQAVPQILSCFKISNTR